MNSTLNKLIIIAGVTGCLLPAAHNIQAQQVANPVLNIPQAITPPTNTAVPYPGLTDMAAPAGGYNYVRTLQPDQPLQSIGGNYLGRQSTDYFDGLGRLLQKVDKKAHADGNDIVTPHVYDIFGREAYRYLPYAAPTSGFNFLSNPGNIKLNVSTQLRGFYDHLGPDEQPYEKDTFENAPSGRVVGTMKPGTSWVGSGRGKSLDYRANADGYFYLNSFIGTHFVTKGGFPRFTIGNSNTDLPQYAGSYAAGELTITRITDEDGKLSEEITDKEGHVVIKRSMYQKQTGILYPVLVPADIFPANYVYTIYVYNDLGQLRAVIPPAAAQPILANYNTVNGITITNTYTYSFSSPTQDQFNGLCYNFFYDKKGRMVEQKMPGKEAEYFVYDKRGRKVLWQDGNLRQKNSWQFTVYDKLDRPIMGGISTHSIINSMPSNRVVMQGKIEDNLPYSANLLIYTLKNYNSIYQNYPGGFIGSQILSYNYYDNYTLGDLPGFSFDPGQFPAVTGNNAVVPSLLSNQTFGLATGSKVKVLDPDDPNANNWLSNVNYYDSKGRIIQTQSKNIKGGLDISSNIYYFQGMLYKNISKQNNPVATSIPGSTDPPLQDIVVESTYKRNLGIGGGNDQIGTFIQKINNGTEKIISAYGYDHLNRNVAKQSLAGRLRHDYSIRGLLQHIQFEDPGTPASVATPNATYTGAHFEENLFYDRGFASKLFNGNIAGITWSGNDCVQKAYGYNYDLLNRLTHAQYNQQNDPTISTGAWENTAYDYTAANISYDINGNLKTMKQMCSTPTAAGFVMDNLVYNYEANSNKLTSVDENAPSTPNPSLPDFKDNHTGAGDYDYDPNGNLKYDLNKNIQNGGMSYSYLNKPEKIAVDGANGGTITYVYDADGKRLQKKTKNNANGTEDIWDYMGNFVYKNNELQYILNEEGRARPVVAGTNGLPHAPTGFPVKYVYDVLVKDHLGNVRSTVTATPATYQYYASHELVAANTENLFFDNIASVRDVKPGSTDPNDGMAARLDGGDPERRIGTAIMLRVKAGDKFQVTTRAFYDGDYQQKDEVGTDQVIGSLVKALTGGTDYSGVPIAELPDNVKTLQTILGRNMDLAEQLDALTKVNNNPEAPKAHLNYLFFDESMRLIDKFSGSAQVVPNVNGGSWNTIFPFGGGTPLNTGTVELCQSCGGMFVVPGNGFFLVYIDNQSIGKDVWFDNLNIGEYTSTVVEEDHYYPYGLTLQTSQTGGVTEQPFKYQSKQLEKAFGLETYDFQARQYDPQIGRFNSIDPLAATFAQWSPYTGMGDNPVRKIDPDGKKFYDFDVNGDYLGTSNDNWFHNLFFRRGRLLNADGSVNRQFKFADRKNDSRNIENGTINKLIVVTDAQIQKMVSRSGGFDHENKTENRSLSDRYDYIMEEGKGGGKMDFSYTQIPDVLPNALPPADPTLPTNNLFLPPEIKGNPNYAHNHLNFGNYLFGASGQAQGFSLLELSYGAHYNSLKNAKENGYSPQLDSTDDQESIKQGFMYGQSRGYDSWEYRVIVGPLQ